MDTLKKILFILSPPDRKNVIVLIIMILIMAILDMIGVASILPFIAVLTNPTLIETNIILNKMFQISKNLGVENNQEFLFTLGILVFVLLVASLVFKAVTTYLQLRFVQLSDYSIGKRLIKIYLNQPYSWFLNRNSADLGRIILSQVGEVVGSGIRPAMEIIAKGSVVFFIVALLVTINLKLAIIVGCTLSFAYGIMYLFVHNYLDKLGKKRLQNNKLRYFFINEVFGAAKEVKISSLEEIYVSHYSDSAKNFALSAATSNTLGQLPRFAIEAIAFAGTLLLILFMMAKTGSFNDALPILSLYVFAGYRLMPALQQMYVSFSQLTYISPSLDKIYEDIKNLETSSSYPIQNLLPFDKSIVLKNISYNYPNAARTTLKNINLSISANTTVGFIGKTGSGKTTTVDIILGLLEAQKGTLEIDGKTINKQNSKSWRSNIGYVPQSIFLSDNTVSANIAFGVNPKNIDLRAVEKASKIANLHEFVINELPNQYQTTIGERGVRLSGGQRQRIGIARALYSNPKVLILDEGTSSLDNETEQVVIQAVNKLSKDITIILVAHRLNTVKNCDTIFKFEKGEIVDHGSYNKIILGDKNL